MAEALMAASDGAKDSSRSGGAAIYHLVGRTKLGREGLAERYHWFAISAININNGREYFLGVMRTDTNENKCGVLRFAQNDNLKQTRHGNLKQTRHGNLKQTRHGNLKQTRRIRT
jgi:hypothetical protein